MIRRTLFVLVSAIVLGAAACGGTDGGAGDAERVARAEKCSSDDEMGRTFCPNAEDAEEAEEADAETEEAEGGENKKGEEHEGEECEVEAPQGEEHEPEGGEEHEGEVEQYDYQCMTRLYGTNAVKAISQY